MLKLGQRFGETREVLASEHLLKLRPGDCELSEHRQTFVQVNSSCIGSLPAAQY